MKGRTSVGFAVFLAVGVLVAPGKPSSSRVDAGHLLESVLTARIHANVALPEPGFVSAYAVDQSARSRLVRQNYTPLVEGEERIAGRDAWVLRLKPAPKRRPWRQVWVDKKLHSILAVRDWSSRNEIRRSARLRAAPSEMHGVFAPSVATTTAPRSSELGAIPPSSVLGQIALPRYVPSGFELVEVGTWPDMPGDRCVIYSDGLFNISLLYRFSAGRCREHDDRGSVVDCGNALAVAVPHAGGSVTVVADLPSEELLRTARSIR
jgi:hypothetical protein